jgi:hypothetical protein
LRYRRAPHDPPPDIAAAVKYLDADRDADRHMDRGAVMGGYPPKGA